MARLHIFDAHLDSAERWVAEMIEQLDLRPEDAPRALHALRAGLHAIRDRLPDGEVIDLGAQLPVLIRGLYYEGYTLHRHLHQLRTRAAMVARVDQELAHHHLDAVDVLRAVIQVLVEHVSDGEIRDVIATLPKPIAEMWHDLTGHALVEPVRTGYSR